MEFFSQKCEVHRSKDEFVAFELHMLETLSFELKNSTPFDLLPICQGFQPLIDRRTSMRMENLIGLAISTRQLISLKAIEIFFACLIRLAKKVLSEEKMAYTYVLVKAHLNQEASETIKTMAII